MRVVGSAFEAEPFLLEMNSERKIVVLDYVKTGELHPFSFCGCATIVDELRRAAFKVDNGVNVGVPGSTVDILTQRFGRWICDSLEDVARGKDRDDVIVGLRVEELSDIGLLLARSLQNIRERLDRGNLSMLDRERNEERLERLVGALGELSVNGLIGIEMRMERVAEAKTGSSLAK